LLRATQQGAQLTTEIELTLSAVRAVAGPHLRVVGITGSNGKSTTTAMIGAALTASGLHALVGGNLGGSLLTTLDQLTPTSIVVLELSSAMLWWLRNSEALQPNVAVLTNFVPNHLDWHTDLEHYRASKQSLLTHIAPNGTAILGPHTHDWTIPAHASTIRIHANTRMLGLQVPGRHNELNAECAHAAIEALVSSRTDREAADSGIRTFRGLPHRLALVGEYRGVRCYDDSKSTTPDATLLAIDALREAGFTRIHLIAGGYDKKVSLDAIAHAATHLASLAAIGTTAPLLCTHGGINCGTLEVAVETVMSRTMPGDAVLLSPGCASWDQFQNFIERGQRFAAFLDRFSK
jgi:UDP-N-acetylmuramoylalanine--D-glutamate ligase